MTKREAAIVAAYTGYLLGSFSDMHEYIEEALGGPVFTHEMGMDGFKEKLQAATEADFIALEVTE